MGVQSVVMYLGNINSDLFAAEACGICLQQTKLGHDWGHGIRMATPRETTKRLADLNCGLTSERGLL